MNSLFLCPTCNEVISNASATCPFCGATINRTDGQPVTRRERHVASQSILAIVVDALRSCLRRRRVQQQFDRVIHTHQNPPEQATRRTSRS